MTLIYGNTFKYLAVVFFCLLVPITGSNAQASEFTPANFGSGRFVGLEISGNNITDDISNVIIPCQAIIEINGIPSNYSCKTSFINKHRVFLRSVINAIPSQSFIPATVDGEAVRVLMNFTVIFACKEGSCANTVTRNHLHHYQEYGLSYVAPQPIVTDDGWYDGFEVKLSWAKDLLKKIDNYAELSDRRAGRINLFSPYSPGYTVSADVDTVGIGTNIEVTNNEAEKRTIKGSRLKSASVPNVASFTQVNFIPGFYKGNPETMRLFETAMTKLDGPIGNAATQGQVHSPDPVHQNESTWRAISEGRF